MSEQEPTIFIKKRPKHSSSSSSLRTLSTSASTTTTADNTASSNVGAEGGDDGEETVIFRSIKKKKTPAGRVRDDGTKQPKIASRLSFGGAISTLDDDSQNDEETEVRSSFLSLCSQV